MGVLQHICFNDVKPIRDKIWKTGDALSTCISVIYVHVGVLHCGPGALGTGVMLLTTCVWALYGGDGAVAIRTGLLSTGIGVRRGVAGSGFRV